MLLTCTYQVQTNFVRFDTNVGASGCDYISSASRDDCDPGSNACGVKVRSIAQIITLQKAYGRKAGKQLTLAKHECCAVSFGKATRATKLLKWAPSVPSCFMQFKSTFSVQGPKKGLALSID